MSSNLVEPNPSSSTDAGAIGVDETDGETLGIILRSFLSPTNDRHLVLKEEVVKDQSVALPVVFDTLAKETDHVATSRIQELTVDVSCLLEHKRVITGLHTLLSQPRSSDGPGFTKLNLSGNYVRTESCSYRSKNKLAKHLGKTLRSATHTSVECLRLSRIEDATLFNMTARKSSLRFYKTNRVTRFLLFRGKPVFTACVIYPSTSYWLSLVPTPQQQPPSVLRQLILERANFHSCFAAQALYQFLKDHRSSLTSLTLIGCNFHSSALEYLRILLEDQLHLLEELVLENLSFCMCTDPSFSQRRLNKAVKRIQRKERRQNQQCGIVGDNCIIAPAKRLKRVVIQGAVSASDEQIGLISTAIGSNPSLTDLTLRQSRHVAALNALTDSLTSTNTALERPTLATLQRLDVEGERTQKWMSALCRLLSHPDCALTTLIVRIAYPRIRNRETSHDACNLDSFVKALQRNRSLERIEYLTKIKRRNQKDKDLHELQALTKPFLEEDANPNEDYVSGPTALKSLVFEVPGINETDPDVEEIFREHFHSRGSSTLEEVQIGRSFARSLGVQFHVFRNRIQNTVVKTLRNVGRDSGISVWPDAIQALLAWTESDVAKTLDPNVLESLYLSGILMTILESPSQLISELQATKIIL